MATKISLSHRRTDSAVDDADPNAETLATAQTFCAAISSFTSEHGFQAIHDVIKLVPQQKLKIQHLSTEFAALENQHEVYARQQILHFEERYEQWRQEKDSLQDEVKRSTASAKEREIRVTSLQKKLEDVEARVGDLEGEHTRLTKRNKDKDEQLARLDAELQRAQADADKRVEELKQAYDQRDALQVSFKEEAAQHRDLREETDRIRERVKGFIQFSVKIKELNLTDVVGQLEGLWKGATTMVERFFRHDLPDDVLKADWTSLREYQISRSPIPLPQSNTDVAKLMRTAFVLSVLSRLVDRFIFQPNYLLREDSGLREVLFEQVSINSSKERYTRGILLSLESEHQEECVEDRVHIITRELLEVANARVLLGPEALNPFSETLEGFVIQCLETWKIVQRGKQKLEPSFDYSTFPDRPWQVFGEPLAEKSLAVTDPEDSLIVIPRIYLIGAGAEPDPLTHGCILHRTDLDAATEELRRSLPSAPFSQTASSRTRNRPVRTTSVSSKKKPFLV